MAKILFVLTGASYWTLADGTRHATGYWAEEFAAPYGELTGNGHEVVVATPGGVVPHVDSMSLRPAMAGSAEIALQLEEIILSAEEFRRPLVAGRCQAGGLRRRVLPRRPRADGGSVAGRRLRQTADRRARFRQAAGHRLPRAGRHHGDSETRGVAVRRLSGNGLHQRRRGRRGPACQGPVDSRRRTGQDGRRLLPRRDLEALHGQGPQPLHGPEPGIRGAIGTGDS